MAAKQINLQHNETGVTLYARIKQEASGNWYNPGTGTFVAFGSSGVVSLTEDANVKYLYSWTGGNGEGWPDGRYYVESYKQVGGSPDPDNDEPVGSGVLVIENDAEVSLDVVENDLQTAQADLDDPGQYKADVSSLALEATAQAVKAKTDGLPADPASETSLATIQADLTTIAGIVADTRRIVKNKMTVDEANSKLQLWDDAGENVLYEWPVTDKDGNAVVLQGTGLTNRDVVEVL